MSEKDSPDPHSETNSEWGNPDIETAISEVRAAVRRLSDPSPRPGEDGLLDQLRSVTWLATAIELVRQGLVARARGEGVPLRRDLDSGPLGERVRYSEDQEKRAREYVGDRWRIAGTDEDDPFSGEIRFKFAMRTLAELSDQTGDAIDVLLDEDGDVTELMRCFEKAAGSSDDLLHRTVPVTVRRHVARCLGTADHDQAILVSEFLAAMNRAAVQMVLAVQASGGAGKAVEDADPSLFVEQVSEFALRIHVAARAVDHPGYDMVMDSINATLKEAGRFD